MCTSEFIGDLGLMWCTCLKMVVDWPKLTEIWDLEPLVKDICTFELVAFNMTWGRSVHLPQNGL